MGIAAYYRGNAVISRQIRAEQGIPEPCHKPEPRPADWGSKAAAKALDHARRVLSGAARCGMPAPSEEMLAEVVREKAKVGAETAAEAARQALAELHR